MFLNAYPIMKFEPCQRTPSQSMIKYEYLEASSSSDVKFCRLFGMFCAEIFEVYLFIDFDRILRGFVEGFGKPKASIFAFFCIIFSMQSL